ncbi:MAG: hypothetical protein ACFBSE_08805 [Prochloraceae cyanobacterium]
MTKNQKRLFPVSQQTSAEICQQAALNLPTANQNSPIERPINYLSQTTNQQEIWQAILIEDEPREQKNKTWSELFLSPLSIAAVILLAIGNTILVRTISTPATIAEIEPEITEDLAPQIPNLAANELIQLDLQTIVTIEARSQTTADPSQQRAIEVKVIPGAYSDLATALLPLSLRPYLYKSHILETISPRELPAEAKLKNLR